MSGKNYHDEQDTYSSEEELSMLVDMADAPSNERELERPPAPVPFYHPNPAIYTPLYKPIPRRSKERIRTTPSTNESIKNKGVGKGPFSRFARPFTPSKTFLNSFSNIAATGQASHYVWHRVHNRLHIDDEKPSCSKSYQFTIRGRRVQTETELKMNEEEFFPEAPTAQSTSVKDPLDELIEKVKTCSMKKEKN